MIGAVVALALAGGAIGVTASGHGPGPAATVTGFAAVTDGDLATRVAAVDVGAVPAQFTPGQVAKMVLDELVGLDLDLAVARQWGITPDSAEVSRRLAAGLKANGGSSAYQQQLIRNPGLGWAGAQVYVEDSVLREQLAAAAVTRLTPVPSAELQALYQARLGAFQHAHVQIVTTASAAVAGLVATRAKADPASFPTLARRYTDDADHRAAGGDYGPALARGQLFASVDDAIFAAAPGAVLGPIAVQETPTEYYVVHVLSVTDIPLSTVTSQLSTIALNPSGDYVQNYLAAARAKLAGTVRVASGYGVWDPATLAVT